MKWKKIFNILLGCGKIRKIFSFPVFFLLYFVEIVSTEKQRRTHGITEKSAVVHLLRESYDVSAEKMFSLFLTKWNENKNWNHFGIFQKIHRRTRENLFKASEFEQWGFIQIRNEIQKQIFKELFLCWRDLRKTKIIAEYKKKDFDFFNFWNGFGQHL